MLEHSKATPYSYLHTQSFGAMLQSQCSKVLKQLFSGIKLQFKTGTDKQSLE